MEYRDPYRTKDKNGAPVLCFQCGTSALPRPMSQDTLTSEKKSRQSTHDTESEQWRSIVSCDFCPLHWHLDCLNPPLLTMPPLDRKWMCPNHADHTLRIKYRVPRQNPTMIDVVRPGQVNNGNIEILDVGTSSTYDKVAVDEVFINGKRYRVPERIIKLDFWDKVHAIHCPTQRFKTGADALLSPLTSLSSLDGDENDMIKNPLRGMGVEDVRLALLLLDMAQTGISTEESSEHTSSLKPTEGLAKDGTDSQGYPDPELPVPTPSESGPSGVKLAERSSERKQPARASKRDIVFSTAFFESNGSGDEEQAAHGSRRPAASAAAVRERKRKAARARHSRTQQRSANRVPKGERVKEEPMDAPVLTGPANSAPPVPVSQASSPTAVDNKVVPNPTVTPSSLGPSTPTLKIRLPRFSLAPGLSTKSAPVQIRTGERSRRSLRRQTSTTGSSSTSVSKADGRGSRAESPRE
jgi:hypothetical protein